jgi:hypothetical protein
MANSLFSKVRIFTTPSSGSGGSDPTLNGRVTNLENNEYKITYYEIVSGASGSLTIPTGAIINAGEFGLSGNCILSKIDGSNKPTFESPKTVGGTVVTASLNETTGAWVASGTYTDTNVALIYSIKIKAINYSNLTYTNIIETVELSDFPISQTITNGVTNKAPSEDAVFDALLGKQDKVNGLTSGGAITIGTFGANNVRVAAAVWFISPSNYTTAIDTDFSVALSSAGLQRYVGFYGNTSNTIVKVEGTESEYAALPTQPANTALIGYILVTDSAAGVAPDLSTYAKIDPRVLTITSSATPTIDVSLYDIVNITALATNITSMTSGLSGVNGNFKSLIINIKDNGVARTITWGSKFSSFFASLPTTTIIGKNLAVGFRYNASTGIYNCWVYSYSI